jgi:hypothetical protein
VQRSDQRLDLGRDPDHAGLSVDLDKDVKSQIDVLMSAVQANAGMITGVVVPRAVTTP